MIRTRDFLLYIGALVLLVALVTSTYLHETNTAILEEAAIEATLIASEPVTPVVIQPPQSDTQQERIAFYQAALSRGAGEHAEQPIVPSATEETGIEAYVTWCESPKDISWLYGVWRDDRVSMQSVEGARLIGVRHSNATLSPVIQLPLSPVLNGKADCLPHEVVGISRDGSLLLHDVGEQFTGSGPATLIGYALDGFPIYGANSEVARDTCGGVAHAAGYRYHIDDEILLRCFSGTPREFIR